MVVTFAFTVRVQQKLIRTFDLQKIGLSKVIVNCASLLMSKKPFYNLGHFSSS